jgi:integrase
MIMEKHTLMGGKLHVYMRPRSTFWQCSTCIDGRNWRRSTGEESLSHAKDIAEDWYLELRGKHRAGVLRHGKSFRDAATQFEREYEIITHGQRSPHYVRGVRDKLRLHLIPYFGDMVLSEITSGRIQEYRMYRLDTSRGRKPPSWSTLRQELVVLRQALKTAQRHGWLQALPDLSSPYKTSGKITHRAWFSPDEYRQLYEATRSRSQETMREPWRRWRQDLHDYVLFMANTGLRPDEAKRLEYRDVAVVRDATTEETILEIEVRGKRGVGYCKSTTGAVRPFTRLKERHRPQPTDRLFVENHRKLFNGILEELNLKFDRDGNRRTAYSLRHTYICLRLMEGADIYQIAKNCRTSVEMIEKYYATHIKNTLDASAINVRRARPTRARPQRKVVDDEQSAEVPA